MDYENKYKEALERARKINSGEGVAASSGWSVCETIFPELKESEDERIRKMIIYQMERWHKAALENNAVQDIKDSADAITWLEKQGEQNVPSREMVLNVWELGNIWKEITKGVCNTEHGTQLEFIIKHWNEGEHYTEWLEKQGEQKPITDFSNLRI